MNTAQDRQTASQRGFSLIEVLVATMITLIAMASVMMLLQKSQTTFQREPEVADMNQSARTGLDMISRDLTMAGLNTPSATAIMWTDGGGDNPDEITIIYADPDIPTVTPLMCKAPGPPGPGCAMAGPVRPLRTPPRSSWPRDDFDPPQSNPENVYHEGQVLFAIEFQDCDVNGDETNGNNARGTIPFEVTQDPQMAGCKLNINHNSGSGGTELNHPNGFDGEVTPGCSVIGVFRVVQYRVNPLPPAANPPLERRDLSIAGEGGQWFPVAMNVENLQVQFAVGASPNFQDDPALPLFDDPTTWITSVSVEIDATSQTQNLQGASEGVFADGNRLRRTFATTVSLRNQQNAMSTASFEAGGLGSAEGYN